MSLSLLHINISSIAEGSRARIDGKYNQYNHGLKRVRITLLLSLGKYLATLFFGWRSQREAIEFQSNICT